MSWQITSKFIIVPKNQTPSPTSTPTPTPSITNTPTPTPTNSPSYDVLLKEDGFNLLQEDNTKIIL
jgi:hypothetical protein